MIDDLHWRERAACRGSDVDFQLSDTERYRRGLGAISSQLDATVPARNVCAGCDPDVQKACLETLWYDPYVVAGGTVPAQRGMRVGEIIEPRTVMLPVRRKRVA